MYQIDLKPLQDFLEHNDYALNAYFKSGENICEIHFPQNSLLLQQIEKLIIKYKISVINKETHSIEVISNISEYNAKINISSYSTKLIILADIYAHCLSIGYDINLIKCFDSKNIESTSKYELLFKIIPDINNELKLKEMYLYEIFLGYINGVDIDELIELSEEKDVVDGAVILLAILQGEV